MSCWHPQPGWHGCGPWYGPPYPEAWYGPILREDDWDWPARRGHCRHRPFGREAVVQDLEARLAGLHDEMRHIEAELEELRAAETAEAARP